MAQSAPQPTFAAPQTSDRLEWKPSLERPARTDAVARFWSLRGHYRIAAFGTSYRERIGRAILPSPLSMESIGMSATAEGSGLAPVTFNGSSAAARRYIPPDSFQSVYDLVMKWDEPA